MKDELSDAEREKIEMALYVALTLLRKKEPFYIHVSSTDWACKSLNCNQFARTSDGYYLDSTDTSTLRKIILNKEGE